MNITGMVHININCSDYENSKAFYEMLGFEEYLKVPERNTEEVAAAVGMTTYRVKGALLRLKNADPPLVLDLLEWKEPSDESSPYLNLYQPGIARLALSSDNIYEDYDFLVESGVEVLSRPVTVALGESTISRFFCFKDPDGIYLELVEIVRS